MASSSSSNPFFVSNLPSPFGTSSDEPALATEATTYAMIPAAPPVDATEVETTSQAIEVVVRWQDSILHIGHLTPARSFFVGEEGCDVLVPADKLGASRMPLVLVEGGSSAALIPAGASARIEVQGKAMKLEDAVVAGLATPSAAYAGAFAVALRDGLRVKSEIGGFSLEVASVAAGRRVAGHFRGDKRSAGLVGLSLALHAGLFAAMFAFVPSLASTEEGEMTDDQRYTLMKALAAASEREIKEQESQAEKQGAVEQQGGGGGAAKGESGKMGSSTAQAANKTYGVSGNAPERTLSRAAAIEDARNFGMAGMLASLTQSDPNAPVAPWGDVANGPDPKSALGNMWGDGVGESYGEGGLGLSGVGEGGGGKWNGVGLGYLDTVGHGSGNCLDANCQGFGNFSGRLQKGHATKSPGGLRGGESKVSGRLPPEVIQRVVRQNFGRFRACYESGLRNNPSLAGRVAVAFTIGRDGAVGTASNGGSDLPDAAVVSCVVKQFYGLSFPAPDDGVVRVTYPIMFNPG